MPTDPFHNLDPAQSVKVLPRHLAGPGPASPRTAWPFPFDKDWSLHQPEDGTAFATSPCLRLWSSFDPQPDKPRKGTWTIAANRVPFGPAAWRITLDASTPVELLHDLHTELLDLYLEDQHSDRDWLYEDATAPHEAYAPLFARGWSHSVKTDGTQTFLAPDRLGGVRHRYATTGPDGPTWRAWGGYPSEPHWQARFSFGTPTTLVAAFTASLISTEPVHRTAQDPSTPAVTSTSPHQRRPSRRRALCPSPRLPRASASADLSELLPLHSHQGVFLVHARTARGALRTLAVATAAGVAGTLAWTPAQAAPAPVSLGPGYTIPDSEGNADASHIGAYGPPGPAVHGDAETYCADPERKGPADAGGYSAPKPVTSWTSSVTGKTVPKERLAQAAYVIGKYGQTRDNAQAAAVDAVVYEYLAGGTYALDGARGKQRLAYPVVSPTARTLAQGYIAEAKRLAGPYTLTITPSVKATTAGSTVTVAVKVTTSAGAPVPKVTVALAESGSGTASGKVTTSASGTAQWEFTAKTAGTAGVTAKADGLPATDLQVLTPKNPAAQRMLVAGGTTSATDSATVTVSEATGGVTIRKKDPEGSRLVGAAFELRDKDGKKAAEGKTDEHGVLAFDQLAAGTYRLRETSSGSPVHDLVPEQTITITAGRTAQANPIDLVDPFKKADLSVKKIDKNTGKLLAGAVIAIRADETDKTGKHIPGKVVTTLTTGTNGTAEADLDVTLKAGTRYWAAETKAPDGYQLDTTPVAFTAKPGADVTVTLADQPVPTTPPPSPSTPPPSPPTTPPTPPTTPPVAPTTPPAPPSGSLAHTGADTTPWLIAGATALLAGGSGLYLFSRRRRTSDTAS